MALLHLHIWRRSGGKSFSVANLGGRYGPVGLQEMAEEAEILAGRGRQTPRSQPRRRSNLGRRIQAGAGCRRARLSGTGTSVETAVGVRPGDIALRRLCRRSKIAERFFLLRHHGLAVRTTSEQRKRFEKRRRAKGDH